MPRVKITEATVGVAALIRALCVTVTFQEHEIDQLCARLEIDPFQLRELFVRALAPAEDIPVENETMPAAWYDNNVQLSRLLLELNDVLELGKAQWANMLQEAEISEDRAAELFDSAKEQLIAGTQKYR